MPYRVYFGVNKQQYKDYESLKHYIYEICGEKCTRCDDYIRFDRSHMHHMDGDKSNNDPSNLTILCPHHHALEHDKEVCGCGNLVPINPHNHRPYWYAPNGQAYCHSCKERKVIFYLRKNVPEEAYNDQYLY